MELDGKKKKKNGQDKTAAASGLQLAPAPVAAPVPQRGAAWCRSTVAGAPPLPSHGCGGVQVPAAAACEDSGDGGRR